MDAKSGGVLAHSVYPHSVPAYDGYASATAVNGTLFVGLRSPVGTHYLLDTFTEQAILLDSFIYGIQQTPSAIASCNAVVYGTGTSGPFYKSTPTPPNATELLVFQTANLAQPIAPAPSSSSSIASSTGVTSSSSTGEASSTTGSSTGPSTESSSSSSTGEQEILYGAELSWLGGLAFYGTFIALSVSSIWIVVGFRLLQ